jgi:hypothetical protein
MASTATAAQRQRQRRELRDIASDDNVKYHIPIASRLDSGRLNTWACRKPFP